MDDFLLFFYAVFWSRPFAKVHKTGKFLKSRPLIWLRMHLSILSLLLVARKLDSLCQLFTRQRVEESNLVRHHEFH